MGCDEHRECDDDGHDILPMNYPYDSEGVLLLLPKIVIIRYSSTGEAGTRTLRVWLNYVGANGSDDEFICEESYPIPDILKKIKYKVVYSTAEKYTVNLTRSESTQNVVVLERC